MDRPRVAEHEDLRRERPRAAADADRAEAPPIDLGDFARQGGQPEVRLARRCRPEATHDASHLDGGTRIGVRR